jgi:hypothetical protein
MMMLCESDSEELNIQETISTPSLGRTMSTGHILPHGSRYGVNVPHSVPREDPMWC